MRPIVLVMLSFPVRPGLLDPLDRRDLAAVLEQIGRALEHEHHDATGTILVPYQERRGRMKVAMSLSGPAGRMWRLEMEYERLPPEYAAEIAAVGKSYEALIENTPGNAGTSAPAYTVTFSYKAEGEELEGISGQALNTYKGEARKSGLLYSQAIELQDAGIALLTQLQMGAHREIKSGQRK